MKSKAAHQNEVPPVSMPLVLRICAREDCELERDGLEHARKKDNAYLLGRVEELEGVLRRILDELGVPDEDYPAPVANAVTLAQAVLGLILVEKGRDVLDPVQPRSEWDRLKAEMERHGDDLKDLADE